MYFLWPLKFRYSLGRTDHLAFEWGNVMPTPNTHIVIYCMHINNNLLTANVTLLYCRWECVQYIMIVYIYMDMICGRRLSTKWVDYVETERRRCAVFGIVWIIIIIVVIAFNVYFFLIWSIGNVIYFFTLCALWHTAAYLSVF